MTGGRKAATEKVRDERQEGDFLHCCLSEDGGQSMMAISDEGDFQLIASEQMGNSAPTPRGTECGQQHERLWRQILLPDGELQMRASEDSLGQPSETQSRGRSGACGNWP